MRISTAGRLYAALGGLFCGLIILSAWWQRKLLPSLLGLLDEDTRLFLTRTLFYVGGKPVRVWFLIKVFLFLVFLSLLSRFSRYVIRILIRHNPNFGEHRQYILVRFVSFFIYVAGILIGIHVERISLSTLVILGGALGVGIGFGLQSLVSNLIAGLILLVEQPIHIGDLIEFGNKSGEVVRIGTRCSLIKTSDNALLVIPNSEFVTKDILNWTASDPKIRVSIPVSVAHGSDVEQIVRVLLGLAAEHADVLENPASEVILAELGQSSITLTLRVWTVKGASDFAKLRSDIYFQIVQRFKEVNIELPLPQLEVHWRSNGTAGRGVPPE
ncbi:mechanosensitive ion channel domain-containing protein [Granulicella sp. dw_53]|uniref:mechanosensitive ion channel family protein n=1 Tax=Granulicella sp. dw_53 TaxID=2719792 RepID=UPI001BD35929|nr:mechanosensitive ion channel domain-containing protein [Granulicella sp. dw_53]